MIHRLKAFFQAYKWPLLSGFCIGTSYIPFPPWAMFFCFVPLWLFWIENSHKTYKKILFSGWITAFTLTLIGFYWVAYVINVHGNLPWPVSILLMLIFCAVFTYYIPIVGAIFKFVKEKLKIEDTALQILLISFLTILAERFYLTLFPWNFGYPWLWARLPGYQVAEFIGFEGLSAFTIFINALIAIAYTRFNQSQSIKKHIAVIIGLIFLINFIGLYRQATLPATDKSIRIMPVQANIGNLAKEMARRGRGFRKQILDKYIQLSEQGLNNSEDVDLIIWPETATPYHFSTNNNYNLAAKNIKKFLLKNNVRLLSGGYYYNTESKKTSNSLLYFNNQGELQQPPYKKSHLLAFGEYMPGEQFIPKKWVDRLNIGSFEPGNGPESFNYNGWRIGPQICYESLFPHFSLQLADDNVNFIVNVTNDSWYGPTSEPYQHLYMTLARAIEVRKPLLRATNTGITTSIQANGEVAAHSPMFKEWTGVFQLNYYSQSMPTLYQKYPWVTVILTLIGLAFTISLNFRKNKGKS